MKKSSIVFLVALFAVVVTAGTIVVQPTAVAAVPAKGEAQMDFMIEVGMAPDGTPMSVQQLVKVISNIGSSGEDGFIVDSFFDITYVSNIGSSGIDGFSVDSFFDVSYKIDNSSDKTFDTEMVALSLRSTLDDPNNPARAIDAVKAAVEKTGGRVYYGHVTVLK